MDEREPRETRQEARKRVRSPRAVAASEEWLFTALQNIGDAVIATDSAGLVTFMNPVAEKLTGWTAKEGQGIDCRQVFRIINEKTRQESESPVTKVLRDGVVSGLANHTLLLSKDGSEISIDDSGSPIRDKRGAMTGVVLIFRDVTGFRAAERTMQEQNEILQTLFDQIPVLVASFDTDGAPRWVNREWERMTGLTLQDLKGRKLPGEFHWDSPILEQTLQHLQLATPGWRDVKLSGSGGAVLDVAWANVRLSDGSSIGIGYDVTLRKQSEEERTTINHRLQRAMVETHHRVKNNLQAISALVDIEVMEHTETVPVAQFVQLRGHVRSLAAMHDLLTRDLSEDALREGVSAKSALEQLLPMLRETSGAKRITYKSEDVRLPVKQGMVLAVILNELVTNAVKHGSRNVDISLAVVSDQVAMEVADDGPGFPPAFDPVKSARTGLSLVEVMSHSDLRGKTSYRNRRSGGARVRITFPAASPALSA